MIPNAWGAGSAKYLAACGFAARGAPTSAGIAFVAGYRDSDPRQSVDAMFAAIASIVAAVPIPVSADLEAGVGDSLDDVQRTFTRAIAIGCAGGSLEDVADYATPDQFVLRSRQDAIEHVRAADRHAAPEKLCLCRASVVGGGVGWGDGLKYCLHCQMCTLTNYKPWPSSMAVTEALVSCHFCEIKACFTFY